MDEFIKPLLLPLVTGAIAGFLINWALERTRARERRQKILKALHVQLESLPRINTHNQSAIEGQPRHLLPMPYPTAPFDIALFSENSISVTDETIKTSTDYLLKAGELNALIDALQGDHLRRIYGQAVPSNLPATQSYILEQAKTEMPQRIRSLAACIETEQKLRKRRQRRSK